jgi:hypothetical protein
MASSTREYPATKKSQTQNWICQPMKVGTLPWPWPVLLQMCCTLILLQPIWVTRILVETAVSWLHENLKHSNQYHWRIKYTELFTAYLPLIKIQTIIQSIYMKIMNQKTNNDEIRVLKFLNHWKGKWTHNWKWTYDKSILLTQVTVTSQAKSVKWIYINWVEIIHK